jgi:MYXO-CTERM domain-containing protein
VFDNGVGGGNNKWCCNDPGGDGHQLDARILAGQHVLTHFTITSGNDSPGRRPTEWSILGSNDGTVWTPIYVQSGPTVFTANNQVIRFDGGGADFATPLPYSWFRYDVQDTQSGDHQLNEIEYFGQTVPEPTTVGLGLWALLGLGWCGWRRRRRS